MQILVVAATELEISPFLALHQEADVLISGVGIPSSIYHIQKRLHQIDYNFVIQAGIAGSFDPGLPLSSTVIVQKDCFADIGVENPPGIDSIFDLKLADPSQFPYQNGWLVNDHPFLKFLNLPMVNGITVNTIHTNIENLAFFKNNFSASVESMEGAALHYVCLQEEIPFVQIRCISNIAGERDKSKWQIKNSIENLNKDLNEIYHSIQQKTAGS